MTGAKTDALNLALREPLLCRFGGLCQQTHIHNLVRDLLLDDQLVFGIDSDLHIVAHRNMRMRRHRTAVGVGKRDLAPRPIYLRQHVLVSLTPFPDRGDLLGQVLDLRAACCALGGVALVEALKIVLELASVALMNWVRDARVKLRSLLLTALIRVPSTVGGCQSHSNPTLCATPLKSTEIDTEAAPTNFRGFFR